MSTDAVVFDHKKLWEDALNGERLSALLDGERLEPEVESSFINALLAHCSELRNKDSFGVAAASKYDLFQKALSVLSATPAGNDYLNEMLNTENGANKVRDAFTDLLKSGFGEYDGAELYSAEMMRVGLLALTEDPVIKSFNEHAKNALKEFMTRDRAQRVLALIKAGAFEANLPEDTLSDLNFLFSSPTINNSLESADESKESNLNVTPEIAPENTEKSGVTSRVNPPYLSDESLREQIGLLAEAAEKEARDYRLFQDQQVMAQMEWNAIMREHLDMVERSVVHKIRDRIANGLTDFGNPITYPSESIFSHSLARMDSNGRVVETYLHFRTGIVGPRVEFPRAEVPDHVYALAALNVRIRGVSKPHINTTFRNPQQAILFMQKSVSALVDAGYDINDISVAPHLRVAFEAFKAERQVGFTITDANEPDYINTKPEAPQVPLMPEEVLAQENIKLNEPLRAMHEKVDAAGGEVSLDKFDEVDIINAMTIISQSGVDDEKTWQAMQNNQQASPLSWDIAVKLFDQLENEFNKLDSKHPSFAPDKTADSSYDLMAKIGPVVLQEMFGVDRLGRVYPKLKEWAIAKDAEIAKLQLHENQVEPGVDGFPDGQQKGLSATPSIVDDSEEDNSETRGLEMTEPYDGLSNVDEMVEDELMRGAQNESPYPQPAEFNLPADGFDNNSEMTLEDIMRQTPPPNQDDGFDSLIASYVGDLHPVEPIVSDAMPDEHDADSIAPPEEAKPDGFWFALSDERKGFLENISWTEMSDDDMRWVLSLSPQDIFSMQRGKGVDYKTIGVADKFETFRNFMSEFYITFEPSQLSKPEKELLMRLPDDLASRMSDPMQEFRKTLIEEPQNNSRTFSAPKM